MIACEEGEEAIETRDLVQKERKGDEFSAGA